MQQLGWVDHEGFRLEQKGVELILHTDRPRKIGTIATIKQGLVYLKNDNEQFIHRDTNSWSVYFYLVPKLYGIKIITPTYIYKILASEALEIGRIIQYPKCEKKLFIPIKYFNIAQV